MLCANKPETCFPEFSLDRRRKPDYCRWTEATGNPAEAAQAVRAKMLVNRRSVAKSYQPENTIHHQPRRTGRRQVGGERRFLKY